MDFVQASDGSIAVRIEEQGGGWRCFPCRTTGRGYLQTRQTAMMSLGARDLLPKSFRVKELKAMIQQFAL